MAGRVAVALLAAGLAGAAAAAPERSHELSPGEGGSAARSAPPGSPLPQPSLILAADRAPAGLSGRGAPGGPAPRFRRELDRARADARRGVASQLRLARGKAAIVALALALVLHAQVSRRRGRRAPRAARRARRLALAALALAALASYYRFSLADRGPHGMHIKDVYHYYIGSKYFPELGYGRIYECTLAVAAERRLPWVEQLDLVRDLRDMVPRTAREVVARGERECAARFGAARWRAFSRDLSWFFARLSGPVWRGILNDHGYNPSPVWTLLAAPLARALPASGLPLLVHADALLVAVGLGALGWAFGFETMCLAAIVWGTGFLWRYTWIGDAFLRQLWFAAALTGLACLGRGHRATAGALLTTSALLRLFPAVFVAAPFAHALAVRLRRGRGPLLPGRFAAGAAVATLVLVGASLAWSGHGAAAFREFAHNTQELRAVAAVNQAGWPALLWRVDGTAEDFWGFGGFEVAGRHLHPLASALLRLAGTGVFLALFWRALPGLLGWEAAALAALAIPVLVAPGGYYFHFVVAAVPLALRRPPIAVWILAACLAWLLNGLWWRGLASQFTVASIVSVILSFGVVAAALRPPAAGAEDQPVPESPAESPG